MPGIDSTMPNEPNLPEREIACCHCGEKFTLHEPMFINFRHTLISHLMLIPAFGMEERKCPKCKTLHVPVFMKADIEWVSTRKEDQQRRIVPPNAPVPMTKEQFEQLQRNAKKFQ